MKKEIREKQKQISAAELEASLWKLNRNNKHDMKGVTLYYEFQKYLEYKSTQLFSTYEEMLNDDSLSLTLNAAYESGGISSLSEAWKSITTSKIFIIVSSREAKRFLEEMQHNELALEFIDLHAKSCVGDLS